MKKIILAVAIMLTALGAMAQQAPSRTFAPLYGQRSTLFDALGCDSTSVVFLGNSITQGCEWHELLGMPNALNRGISGDVVEGVRLRAESIVKGRPAKIFLMIGVNDVSHDLTADSIATAIVELVDYIRTETPDTRLYVQSCLPINNSYGRYKKIIGREQIVRDINTLIEPQVVERGATWINLYPAFSDEEGNLRTDLTNDGLHLLGSGYLLWRDLLQPYLND